MLVGTARGLTYQANLDQAPGPPSSVATKRRLGGEHHADDQ
jgi:hypothetical protein